LVVFVVCYGGERIAARPPGRTDLLWTTIPIMIVLFLAARSWVAVFDLERPAVASAVTRAEIVTGVRGPAPH
jgi:heme/copper-type cytochrome/quinol oxidase subunit 2